MNQKRILLIVSIITAISFLGEPISAQDKKIVYTPANVFNLYGKAFDPQTEPDSCRYQRLPMKYQGVSRESLWYLSTQSAGMYLRFRTDSPEIFARWTSKYKNSMNHMTDTGTRGLDLYAYVNGQWQFVRSGRPEKKRVSNVPIIQNMQPQMRDYMLYLSLYDGITSLEIGVDEGSVLEQSTLASPSADRPIVMYGTSILQGGCASRPGMAFTNIIARKLDREVINLGFSGNAFLDFEVAELMAAIKNPSVFVLDYVPNASPEMITEKGEKFFRILRDAHPNVPVIFLEDPVFPFSYFDQKIKDEIAKKNAAQEALFRKLSKSGEKNIYFLNSSKEIGRDNEATVDGVHFTDLGMVRYTDFILPTLKKVLKKSK